MIYNVVYVEVTPTKQHRIGGSKIICFSYQKSTYICSYEETTFYCRVNGVVAYYRISAKMEQIRQ